MKKILIIGCLFIGSMLSAMEFPDNVQVVKTEHWALNKSSISEDIVYVDNFSITTGVTKVLAFQTDVTLSVAIPHYVASVALIDVGLFYRPVIYENYHCSGTLKASRKFKSDHFMKNSAVHKSSGLPQNDREYPYCNMRYKSRSYKKIK